MAQWAVFASFTVLIVGLFLALARASQAVVSDDTSDGNGSRVDDGTDADEGDSDDSRSPDAEDDDSTGITAIEGQGPIDVRTDGTDGTDDGDEGGTTASSPDGGRDVPSPVRTADGERIPANPDPDGTAGLESLPTSALLVNVAVSQGLFGTLLLGAAWYAEIPLAALGVPDGIDAGALVLGVAFGSGLYVLNELAAAGANAFGVEHPEELRAMLAPDTRSGWVLLLAAILPTIAIVEELLFRAALIGALSAGFPISPWVLAVVSSAAFALGHGAQGTTGVLVTGALGFLLAAGFVLTGNLLVVIVAHYLVNAFEFLVHEGLGVEWSVR